MKLRALSVSEINKYIKNTLESDPIISYVAVKGEISNFKLHSSGHAYFSLKDDNSKISCVMFRSDLMKCTVDLAEGMAVEISGNISVYERDGRYQLYGRSVKQVGLGDLQQKFEALKKDLLQLGYFDQSKKKVIPHFVDRVGVITSPTGAAIRDILSVARRRNPKVELVIYPVRVQGDQSCEEIVTALDYFNTLEDIDVIIVSRGGGALEDLWSFNERPVAEAIYRSRIPVVSGVGHEVDFTISDFVSDLRVPTPSAAAELVIKPLEDMRFELRQKSETLSSRMESRLKLERRQLLMYNERNINSIDRKIQDYKSRLQRLGVSLDTLSPLKTLDRGYAVASVEGHLLDSVEKVKVDDTVNITLKDGEIKARVQEVEVKDEPIV